MPASRWWARTGWVGVMAVDAAGRWRADPKYGARELHMPWSFLQREIADLEFGIGFSARGHCVGGSNVILDLEE